MREINPGLRLALDLGPVAVYFGAYYFFQDREVNLFGTAYTGVVLATLVFVPAVLLALAASWALTRTVSRMAVFTAVIVAVFGGLTIWLNDDTFTKMRPTVVYGIFGAILAGGLWFQGRSYLAYLMGNFVPLTDVGWWIFTRNWVIFFAFMSAFNEFVWRVLGEEAWIWLDTFGQLLLTFAFMATQYPLLTREWVEEEVEATPAPVRSPPVKPKRGPRRGLTAKVLAKRAPTPPVPHICGRAPTQTRARPTAVRSRPRRGSGSESQQPRPGFRKI